MRYLLLTLLVITAGALSANAAQSTANPATMMPNEWDEFRYERLAVIQSNPKLAAEQRTIDKAMAAHQDKVGAAMIKINPDVAPLLAKMTKLLRSKWTPAPGGTPAVTSAEWQQLRTIRAAALQAHPDLAAEGQKLLAKKKSFDARVDAAMVLADPDIAPLMVNLKKRILSKGQW